MTTKPDLNDLSFAFNAPGKYCRSGLNYLELFDTVAAFFASVTDDHEDRSFEICYRDGGRLCATKMCVSKHMWECLCESPSVMLMYLGLTEELVEP